MSRSTWHVIEVDYKGKKKKYQLNDKGALKFPKNKNLKSKRFISENPKLNLPPHQFSVAVISDSSNSKDDDNVKASQEKSKKKFDACFQDFVLDFLNFDDIKDSKIQSEYEYSDEIDFDDSEFFYD